MLLDIYQNDNASLFRITLYGSNIERLWPNLDPENTILLDIYQYYDASLFRAALYGSNIERLWPNLDPENIVEHLSI